MIGRLFGLTESVAVNLLTLYKFSAIIKLNRK